MVNDNTYVTYLKKIIMNDKNVIYITSITVIIL